MSLRQRRMIEIVGGVAGHPELLHNPPRPYVARNCHCNDLIQPQGLKSKIGNRSRTFRRQTSSPIFRGQTPANFNAGRERSFEPRDIQTDEADEAAIAPQLGCAQSESMLFEMGLNFVYRRVALFSRQA